MKVITPSYSSWPSLGEQVHRHNLHDNDLHCSLSNNSLLQRLSSYGNKVYPTSSSSSKTYQLITIVEFTCDPVLIITWWKWYPTFSAQSKITIVVIAKCTMPSFTYQLHTHSNSTYWITIIKIRCCSTDLNLGWINDWQLGLPTLKMQKTSNSNFPAVLQAYHHRQRRPPARPQIVLQTRLFQSQLAHRQPLQAVSQFCLYAIAISSSPS